ncbi:MAG: hypothetical protein MZW92_28390 [Comamonadaceae bacterium]|nr:hypothetical protein [Comamonadaceae bacterium]
MTGSSRRAADRRRPPTGAPGRAGAAAPRAAGGAPLRAAPRGRFASGQ